MRIFKIVLPALVVYVNWVIQYKPYLGGDVKVENHSRVFLTHDEAMEFIDNSPKKNEWFECKSSVSGKDGHCMIKNIYIDKKRRVKE